MNYTYEEHQNYIHQSDDLRAELDAWLMVSGDMDDFIFYGEDDNIRSEK